jgi:hypothetical protein
MSIRDIILNDEDAAVRDRGDSYDFSGAAVSTPHPSFMASLALMSPVSSSSSSSLLLSPSIPARRSGVSGGSSSVNFRSMEEAERREYILRELDKIANLLLQCGLLQSANNIKSLDVGKVLHPRIIDLWITLVVNPLLLPHNNMSERDKRLEPNFILLQTGFMDDTEYTRKIATGGVFHPMRYHTILAPIQHPRTGHWVLLVCDMGNMRVKIFDIMNHSDKKELIYEPFKAWLKTVHSIEDGAEWENSDDLNYSQHFNIARGMTRDDFAKAEFKKNSGIFTCMFMFYIYQRLEMFEFKPGDSLKARVWVIHKLKRAILSSFF